MYKAIKDNKIISLAEKAEDFQFLEYDEIIEDSEHTFDDYGEYFYNNECSEFLLKSEIPLPTNEEQQEKRHKAYVAEIDELHSQKLRHEIIGDWTEEDEEEYRAKVIRLSQEIAERYPYYEE